MQVVGIFLLIVSVWTVYCGFESFNPLLMAVLIMQNPSDPHAVIAAAKTAVASSAASADGTPAPNLGTGAMPGVAPAAPNTPTTPNLGSGAISTGTAGLQSYAFQQLAFKYGITDAADQQALVQLWNHESGWRPTALNASSGAHGIPQALDTTTAGGQRLPRNASAQQQIDWGLQYIHERYGTPAKAWAFEMSHSPNWY